MEIRRETKPTTLIHRVGVALLACVALATVAAAREPKAVVIVTVDALRADRLSAYGYERQTSPAIDALLDDGVLFSKARTVEPLTGPALCSMITGLEPQEHAATRNGLRIREGLDSLPKILAGHGWQTAAFVSNWTLKDNLTRLGEHFDHYGEVFTRRRWFGLLNSEATAEDVTDGALDWVSVHQQVSSPERFLIWVHYVEPHAPYRFHEEYAGRLEITDRDPKRSDRYDTEVAAVDAAIGRLLAGIEKHIAPDDLLVVFAADHGESLGEHDYWGHGRYLYEPSLRIPLGIRWKGSVEQRVIDHQATILDIPPTILDLLGLEVPESFAGISWASAARGRALPPERVLCYQAHKGAVHGEHDDDRKRSKGLLSVGIVEEDRKEILRVKNNTHMIFDLETDSGEISNLATENGPPSDPLLECLGTVSEGLGALDRLKSKKLDDETIEQLKALGYIE
jgi:arylsulfatase A-like enzyme